MTWHVITTAQHEKWMSRLGRFDCHDVYHLPGYHRAYETGGEARAVAFHVEIGGDSLFHPLMIRPIRRVGTAPVSEDWNDAESVYGYSGPLATTNDQQFLAEAWAAFDDWCRGEAIVSEFIRYNPLIKNHVFAAPGSRTWLDRQTVVLRLDQGEEALWRGYAGEHRTSIRKAQKSGVTCEQRELGEALPAFIEIYRETMRGLGADDFYLFSEEHYASLAEGLGNGLVLFMARHEGRDIAGALFLVHGDRLHYHLAGNSQEHRHLAGSNLLIHSAGLWGMARGLTRIHLGGGRSAAPDDSLLGFKARFSRERCDFHLGTRVLDESAYDWLLACWLEQSTYDTTPDYNQLYRLNPKQPEAQAP